MQNNLEFYIKNNEDNLFLLGLIKSIYQDFLSSIKNKIFIEKIIIFFWLLGPFILLIERTPADIWISLISLSFVIRCLVNVW